MALESVSIAAATAVLKYNLLNDSRLRQSKQRRKLRGAALAGSAAAGDTVVELYAGTRLLATLFNSATGFPTRDHLFPVGEMIEATDELQAIVTDAATTNAINLLLDFVG